MNLIEDAWVPIIRHDGTEEKIAPWQIAERENPVVDINTVRADFYGAMYQFLIGLLQTFAAPEDGDEWLEYAQTPPNEEQIQESLIQYKDAFHLMPKEGAAFLQDFDMPDGEQKGVAALLIEAPGGKTLKDNLDHFVKGGQVEKSCESCAAIALFTLQTNAPSGGVGHRVGLRGGGPLTTLVMPQSEQATLWQKLWINVLPQEDFHPSLEGLDAKVLPWLASTRISDKTGINTTLEDVNPLQMYWGMPRRIRFDSDDLSSGHCDICGEYSDSLISHFTTKNYGVNYEGPWVHPLTPYRFDSDHKEPPLSLKGQQGGLGYRHWLGLAWQDDSNGDSAAIVTQSFNEEKISQLQEIDEAVDDVACLWCFGYDMDNMKARCWYEQQMPLIYVDKAYREDFIGFVQQLITSAKDLLPALRGQIKQAWFSRPKDAKGDISMIDHDFWQATDTEFYKQLHALTNLNTDFDYRQIPAEIAEKWLKTLRQVAFDIFDHWVLEGEAEDMNMKRITQARGQLAKKLKSIKSLKDLEQIAATKEKEVTNG
jgi:CRISPR system Cascade subunit CasA